MQFITTYNWTLANEKSGNDAPLEKHIDLLNEIAFDEINRAIKNFEINSGDFSTSVGDEGEETVPYRCVWSHEVYTPPAGLSIDNPVIAVVKENKEEGGFDMSIANVPYCDVVVIEDDLNCEGNEVEIEGVDLIGWSTSCDFDALRVQQYDSAF
jgi:hypothetical protein